GPRTRTCPTRDAQRSLGRCETAVSAITRCCIQPSTPSRATKARVSIRKQLTLHSRRWLVYSVEFSTIEIGAVRSGIHRRVLRRSGGGKRRPVLVAVMIFLWDLFKL